MWVQIVGKVRMALTPPLNHWWHAPLYVSARGLTTSAIPYGDSDFEVEFDFVEHRLTVLDAQPGAFVMDLRPRSVAEFYLEFMAGLRGRGIEVRIYAEAFRGRGRDPVRRGRGARLIRPGPRGDVLAWPG